MKIFQESLFFPFSYVRLCEEALYISLEHHNKSYILLRIQTNCYYGGAHEENKVDDVLFSLSSGEQVEISSLILENKKINLIDYFNVILNKEHKNIESCLGGDLPKSEFKIQYSDIKYLKFSGSGIYLDIDFLSYAERACEPGVYINMEDAREYFHYSIFE